MLFKQLYKMHNYIVSGTDECMVLNMASVQPNVYIPF